MHRITFTFGPPYDIDHYGWVELIVEAGGQVAHGAHTIPIHVAQYDVANLGRVSHVANAEPQMHYGWWHGDNGPESMDTIILLDIRPTASTGLLSVRARAVDRFEPSKRVETEFTVTRPMLRQFQRDCGRVLRKEAKEAVLIGEEAATAQETLARSPSTMMVE